MSGSVCACQCACVCVGSRRRHKCHMQELLDLKLHHYKNTEAQKDTRGLQRPVRTQEAERKTHSMVLHSSFEALQDGNHVSQRVLCANTRRKKGYTNTHIDTYTSIDYLRTHTRTHTHIHTRLYTLHKHARHIHTYEHVQVHTSTYTRTRTRTHSHSPITHTRYTPGSWR